MRKRKTTWGNNKINKNDKTKEVLESIKYRYESDELFNKDDYNTEIKALSHALRIMEEYQKLTSKIVSLKLQLEEYKKAGSI